jgi:choline dehydrogenase-like flavoprotein
MSRQLVPSQDTQDPSRQLWDSIIVGTGVGGATVGQALARRGLNVLFLERGARVDLAAATPGTTTQTRLARGWWPHPISRRRPDGTCLRFDAPIGCALGGSSIHFAGALERMDRTDFEPLATAGDRVVTWPVSYDDFAPYYAAAENLYGVALEPGLSIESRVSEWDRALFAALSKNGLKPQALRVAIRYDDECKECIGVVCLRGCKSDARTACLNDALDLPNCRVLDHCDVQTLQADGSRVRTLHANHHGRAIALRAKVVVLSAGALHSPQILLRSRNSAWPDGLANRSDQVGRNLMFHTSDLYAIWAPHQLDRRGRQRKYLSVRDFYVRDKVRLGSIQSLGLEAGRGDIAGFLKDVMRRRGVRNEMLLSLLVKLPSHAAAWKFGAASIFAAMTEDDPHPENRITLDPAEPDGASFVYSISADLRRRADALYEAFSRHTRPWKLMRLNAELHMNYGHPCGTCKFGDDPARSVLDSDCRAHDIENLFVVDASFMPRSGAINPGLTIAANALRVAPRIFEAATQT